MELLPGQKSRSCLLALLVFTLLLMQFLAVSAQETKFYFDRYNTDNGLPTNHIHCIFQDARGYIWLGSPIGLIRYNGYTFTEFKHSEDDSASIGKGSVWTIYEDKYSNLWIGTQGGGLNLFDRDHESFIHFRKQAETGNSVNDDNINAITSDKYDNLWIGTGKGGLNCYNLKTKKFTYFKNNPIDPASISHNSVMSVFVDSQDQLWIGTWGGGLNAFNYDYRKFTSYLFDKNTNPAQTNNVVWTIYQDKKSNLWLGTWNSGLVLFDTKAKKFSQFKNIPGDRTSISNNVVLSVLEDNSGNFWVGTESSINLMDREEGTFSIPKMVGSGTKDELFGSSIYSLYNDKQGIVWIGTFGQGINILDRDKRKFTVLKLDQDLIGSWVNCAYEDENGNLWIGTGENGIVKYERKHNHFENLKSENSRLPNKFVGAICRLDDKTLLFSTFKGLWEINRITCKISLFNDTKDAANIGIYNFNNKFIVLNENPSLRMYNIQSKQYIEILRTDTLPAISSFLVSSDSCVWLGSDNNGVLKYNLHDHSSIRYRYDSGSKISISDNDIRSIFEDRAGNIWIGTAVGLNRLNPRTSEVTIYKERDGLANNTVADITEDSRGNLWISTFNGVSCLDIKSNCFSNFNEPDGLPDKAPRFFLTRRGELILTGSKGFCLIDPERISRNEYIPSVILTDFKLLNRSVVPGEKGSPLKKHISETTDIVLNHRQSVSLTLSWVALNYRLPEANQYACKMEGFDQDWNNLGTLRTSTYTNLNPGKYKFRVKASNNDGIWNETGVSLRITILPPFWQTWWFITLVIICFIGVLYFWYQQRVLHLKSQNIMLQNKVLERTKDIKRQQEVLQEQKEALVLQADSLQEANFLLMARGEELEAAAKELKVQDEELSLANEELIRLNSTKDRLFSIVAHDLKNPFSAIIGFSELITGEFGKLSDDEKQEMLGQIITSSKSAYKLLENLLDWARSQTNQIEFKPVLIHIRSIAERTHQLLELQALAKNIKMELDIPDDIFAYADAAMLETIIRNLVINAIKFTPKDGRIVLSAVYADSSDLKDKGLIISSSGLIDNPNSRLVKISVSDTGVGIGADVLDNLFRIDVKHITKGTSGERGTGLGLILCKEFAEKNWGSVFVESKSGQGSTFSLYLHPNRESISELSESQEQTENSYEELETGSADHVLLNPGGEKYQILIVEDNTELRNYLMKSLEAYYQVEGASNGKTARDLAFRTLPDLIVSDVMMPEMDGFELCKIIKSDERTSHIPIILLTAKVGEESHLLGLETGANDYLIKPYNIRLLKVKIRNMLEMQQRMHEQFSSRVFIGPSELPISNMDALFIKRAIGIVEINMRDEGFNVEKFSELLNMSHIQLYRKLGALANQSPSDFIRNIRLQRAAQLIAQGHLNISQVCFETGFNNPSYFTKCFKKEFGVLPKDYPQNSGSI